jgi:hypothetical protein
MRLRALGVVVGMLSCLSAHADESYARFGLRFEMKCGDDPASGMNFLREGGEVSFRCRNQSANDPQILVRYEGDDLIVHTAELLGDDLDWRPSEFIWSSDPAGAIAVSGSSNAYAGRDVIVFRMESGKWVRKDVLLPARKRMLDRLARCWPEVRTAYTSPRLVELNMSAVAWRDARTLVVFGEVTPSSSYGYAMGQVMGYEIDIRDGKVLREMTADEFKARWQSAAGWPIRIPDEPDCGRLFFEDRAPETISR